MNTDSPTPNAVEHDAGTRAFRTLIQGLFVDLVTAVTVALTVAIAGGIEWTSTYWVALSLAVAKSAITAIVSYFARTMVPPANVGGAA